MFEHEFKHRTHQLEKIFEVTGTPSAEDIAFMEEGPMKTVCNEMEMEMERREVNPYLITSSWKT